MLLYSVLFAVVTVVCSEPRVWSPVFPNVSFIFRDNYDELGWRLTKPDFLQLRGGDQPVVAFFMRKATDDHTSRSDPYPFYSVNCTDCQVNVAYSFDGGWTWERDSTFLKLPPLNSSMQYGWRGRAGARVVLQEHGSVPVLHLFIPVTTESRSGLYHFSSNESLPDTRNVAINQIHSLPQELEPNGLGSPPHSPIVVNKDKRLLVALHKVTRRESSSVGESNTFVLYSDDLGCSWEMAEPQLVVPSPLGGGGACEPTVIELMNGTIWMLIRNQNPVLYQSFSYNRGTTWTPPTASPFISNNSPAIFIRLSARKPGILLVWNNGFNVNEVYHHAEYGIARQVIHAAVSYDEGKTWSGFRELYRDPHMAEPYIYGDHGSAYPEGEELVNGTIILSTGQGAFRQVVLLFDPEWLLEKVQYTKMDDVINLNDTWDYQGNYFTTLDTTGLDVIIDPTNASCSRDLKVIRMQESKDLDHPPCLVYNFLGAKKGSLALFFYPTSNETSVQVSLMDFFTLPADVEVESMATFALTITSDPAAKKDGHTIYITATEYHYVEFDWDMHAGVCNVSADDNVKETLLMRPESEDFTQQPSYLRFRLLSGMLYLRSIEAEVA